MQRSTYILFPTARFRRPLFSTAIAPAAHRSRFSRLFHRSTHRAAANEPESDGEGGDIDSDDDEVPGAIVKAGTSSPKKRGVAIKNDSRFKEYRVYQAQTMVFDDHVAPKSSYEVSNASPPCTPTPL